MITDATIDRVFAVVLAAGSASRFGSTKQLAITGGVPLARRAVDAAYACCAENTVLVAGYDWEAVSNACMPAQGFLIVNERFDDGMGSSLSLAVRTLRHAASAIVVVLADQPLITAGHLRSLCDKWSGADDEIIATAFADTLGPPVLFPRACFDDLAGLRGDSGGRHLLNDERFTVKTILFEDAAVDIDTPDDLRDYPAAAQRSQFTQPE